MNAIMNKIRSLYNIVYNRLGPTKNKWTLEKLIYGNMQGYKANHGYEFDIYQPDLFTEKIQWYKLFYQFPEMAELVDKYLFKEYIEKRLGKGYTIPLYGSWTNIHSLENEWGNLPEEFVLKSNVQSDGKYIKFIQNKSQMDFHEIKKELKQWLKVRNTLINSYCRAYYQATPRIIAEKYEKGIGNQLYDYKIFCFNGEPTYVYVASDRFISDDHNISFYDLDWNMLNVKYGNHKNEFVKKPTYFNEMLNIAKKLSVDFPFIRVDFFETSEQLYVAELTLYPGGGLVEYNPVSFNKQLGDMFILPKQQES